MDFNALVKFIKSQGCKVVVYRKKERVNGAIGEFGEDPPRINIATKGQTKKLIISTLLHEYAHFLQWREGFSQYIDGICGSYEIHYDWIRGRRELTDDEKQSARNAMLAIEYDAELRSYDLGKELGVKDFDPDFHLQEAACYMAHLKWSWGVRLDWDKRLSPSFWKPKKLTHEELFAPLTARENVYLKKVKVDKKCRKKRC